METEVKIQIRSSEIDGLRRRLEDQGAIRLQEPKEEINSLFDDPKLSLHRSGCALRLRKYGGQTSLTFKGPVVEHPAFKQRPEVETRVEDFQALGTILEQIGLRVVFEYRKVREIYRLSLSGQEASISIDQTPVGCFVEVEGPEATILEVTHRFGWSPEEFIRKNYVDLYREAGL